MVCGNTRDEAAPDHERNLRGLQKRCSQRKIMLNDETSVLQQTQVKFMGHMITTERVQAH